MVRKAKAKKNRGLDELYDHIWQKAKSYAWYMTLAAIYIFFSLMVFGIELNIAMVLGILLLVHIGVGDYWDHFDCQHVRPSTI